MITLEQSNELNASLAQIEQDILNESTGTDSKRIPARYFMIFLVADHEEETTTLLKHDVRALLSNPDAAVFIPLLSETEGPLKTRIEEALRLAGSRRVDVETLNTFMLCPVILRDTRMQGAVDEQMRDAAAYIDCLGRAVIWQPFMVLDSRPAEYAHVYRNLVCMEQFLKDLPDGSYHRCCLMSDQDEEGFLVTQENILDTIAVCAILQNTKPDNKDTYLEFTEKIRASAVDKADGRLFYTARGSAVSNPIRRVTFQRMLSVVDYFFGTIDQTDQNVLDRMRFSFVRNEVDKYMSRLPQADGRITFFPLYAVMQGPNLQTRLEAQVWKYYLQPLQKAQQEDKILEKLRLQFYQEYFRNGGSLTELKEAVQEERIDDLLRQHMGECGTSLPLEELPPKTDVTKPFLEGIYLNARNYTIEKLSVYGKEILEHVLSDLKKKDTLRRIQEIEDSMEGIRQCIIGRQRQLRDIETVLGVGQNELMDSFEEVNKNWAKQMITSGSIPRELNQTFDSLIYKMLIDGVFDLSYILRLCYEAVRPYIESNAQYLDKLSQECMSDKNKPAQFAKILENSRSYTLKTIQARSENMKLLIGDRTNYFLRGISGHLYNSMEFDFHGLDKIDILYVSGAFCKDDLFIWRQIEMMGREQQDGESTSCN